MQTTNSPVLFPTDFQPHSLAAFEHAVHLAAANKTKLIALHVSNMPDMPWSSPSHPTHHEFLQEQLRQLESSRVEIDRIFAVADPGPEICRIAKKLRCGMIVMGVANKSGIDQVLLGSLHDYIRQHATCTVVTYCQQRALPLSATVEATGTE